MVQEEDDMADVKVDSVLDAKGLNCPMPVLKTKKALDAMASGQVLEVLATDKGAKSDITALLKRLGHEMVEMREEGGVIEFYIRKK